MPKIGEQRYIDKMTNQVVDKSSGFRGVIGTQTWDGTKWVDGNTHIIKTQENDNGVITPISTEVRQIVNGVEQPAPIINDQKPETQTPETQKPETQRTPKPNNRKWVNNNTTNNLNNNTYTAPDGKTYTGMSQEQFNQRLQDYEMENAALKQRQQVYQQRRNETVGNGSMTKDQLFKDALSKMYENPSAFTDEQKDLLYRTGEQLGYFNDTMQASPKQTETATGTTTTTVAMNEPTTTADRISYTPETQTQTQPQQTGTTKQGGAYALGFSL